MKIGASAKRVGGFERVTGQQKYVGDIRLDNMLAVKMVHLDFFDSFSVTTGAHTLDLIACV